MTDIAMLSPVERIARVLAAYALSPNAEGGEAPGEIAIQVDAGWQAERDRALAVLRTLREPSGAMVAAGASAGSEPAAIWTAMILAAIEEGREPCE